MLVDFSARALWRARYRPHHSLIGGSKTGVAQKPGAIPFRNAGLIIVSVAVIDFLSKSWAESRLRMQGPFDSVITLIRDHLWLSLAYDKGGAWGLLHDAPDPFRKPFFSFCLLATLGLVYWLHSSLRRHQLLASIGFGLLTGGAVGNLLDRIVRKGVIDFVQYRAAWVGTLNALAHRFDDRWFVVEYWPTFNLADVAIVLGITLLTLGLSAAPTYGIPRPGFLLAFRSRRALVGLALRLSAAVLPNVIGLALQFLFSKEHNRTDVVSDAEVRAALSHSLLVVGIQWGTVVVVGLLTVRIWQLGRQYSQLTPEELQRLDPRPPVLILRAFKRDDEFIAAPWWHFRWLPIGRSAASLEPLTFEEALVRRLQWFGPPIAIGRPGEQLPAIGAARVYANDDQWQDRVVTLIAAAQRIVAIADDTPAVRWELRAVRDAGGLTKLLLVIPPSGARGRSRKRERRWYRAWEGMSRDVEFLPPIDDTTAAVSFETTPPTLIVAKSARAWDAISAIEKSLNASTIAAG